MNNLEKEFTLYPEASELKALGFNEPCFKMSEHRKTCVEKEKPLGCQLHNLHCGYPNCTIDKSITPVPLPTYSQAFRWFRKKYNLHSTITSISQESWQWHITRPGESLGKLYEEDFSSHEEAELDCLRKLISIVKQQQQDDTTKTND